MSIPKIKKLAQLAGQSEDYHYEFLDGISGATVAQIFDDFESLLTAVERILKTHHPRADVSLILLEPYANCKKHWLEEKPGVE